MLYTLKLTGSSFLQAFVRFVQLRGAVCEMYSDCGSNFLSAERELRGVKRWNQQTLHESLPQKGVEWHFNPPFANWCNQACFALRWLRVHSLWGTRKVDLLWRHKADLLLFPVKRQKAALSYLRCKGTRPMYWSYFVWKGIRHDRTVKVTGAVILEKSHTHSRDYFAEVNDLRHGWFMIDVRLNEYDW